MLLIASATSQKISTNLIYVSKLAWKFRVPKQQLVTHFHRVLNRRLSILDGGWQR